MIFDEQALFSDKQAITADAASTNVIDLGAPGHSETRESTYHSGLRSWACCSYPHSGD